MSTQPDFLVHKDGMSYYVEARCIFEGGNDRGSARRLKSIYDSLNSIESGGFHLAVTPVRIGKDTPSTKRLRRDLEAWLADLDPEAGVYRLDGETPEHRYKWAQDDWELVFQPLPRSAAVRGIPTRRALGVFLPAEASIVDDITSLRDALSEKGSKYGELGYPLVLAVNIGSGFHDDRDTEQALFGTIGWQLNFDSPESDPLPILTEQGYWGWPGRPSHTHVAGVLIAEGLHYGGVARYSPTFWPHPHATRKVEPLRSWRVARFDAEETMIHHDSAVRANEYFELPPGWPIGDRFPRTRQGGDSPL
ncbi:MAG: hypothetical protein IT190_09580 [Microbacteriaceae bacterium]|nr:hypothetical protein [Microbacteriaceae bacterium]